MSKESKKTEARAWEIVTELLELFGMDQGEVAGIHIEATRPLTVSFDARVRATDGRAYVVRTLADGTQA